MVHSKVQTLVNNKKQEITTGRFKVFIGPIYDRDGNLVVAAGEVLSDPDLLSMNYLLKCKR